MNEQTPLDGDLSEEDRLRNEEVVGGFVMGLILTLTIIAYACGAVAVLAALWFVLQRVVL
jgi:hypothetical protein